MQPTAIDINVEQLGLCLLADSGCVKLLICVNVSVLQYGCCRLTYFLLTINYLKYILCRQFRELGTKWIGALLMQQSDSGAHVFVHALKPKADTLNTH